MFCLPVRDCTQTGLFWSRFEFYALLLEFVSDFVLRISYFLLRACLFPATPAWVFMHAFLLYTLHLTSIFAFQKPTV
ncbi:hypothetical protein KsCSTR_35530 [Candidatus Kuenenia stuttgartiensis]|uniref:Uncharacterized protein n=1 Tax=Kuenenia stuttgartiensis TaxID=174633 RepID=Q1Q6Q9_KUEST|nr:hypothetical protein KsCSTR_35530 [Candidatus Kuenenia stuttgartiensis]CAJ73260.1 unknown protein [Candidatus Kuenenia stuttgartiensis]